MQYQLFSFGPTLQNKKAFNGFNGFFWQVRNTNKRLIEVRGPGILNKGLRAVASQGSPPL